VTVEAGNDTTLGCDFG